jgi:hypothetical protein
MVFASRLSGFRTTWEPFFPPSAREKSAGRGRVWSVLVVMMTVFFLLGFLGPLCPVGFLCPAAAASDWRVLARQGDSEAAVKWSKWLGSLGSNVDSESRAESMRLLEGAAEAENATAQLRLGYLLLAENRPDSTKAASRWFRRAALQGWLEARYNLGVLLATGQGVEKNLLEAAFWFSLVFSADAATSLTWADQAGLTDMRQQAARQIALLQQAMNERDRRRFQSGFDNFKRRIAAEAGVKPKSAPAPTPGPASTPAAPGRDSVAKPDSLASGEPPPVPRPSRPSSPGVTGRPPAAADPPAETDPYRTFKIMLLGAFVGEVAYRFSRFLKAHG